MALRGAGYEIGGVLLGLSAEEQDRFGSLPAPVDPYDFTPREALFQHLDMLWAIFGATGEFAPLKTLSQALAWRADYDAVVKLQSGPKPATPRSVTSEIVRGIVYTAVGWSMESFQRNDGVVADYIDFLLASPDTPAGVKAELRGLLTNAAFKGRG